MPAREGGHCFYVRVCGREIGFLTRTILIAFMCACVRV